MIVASASGAAWFLWIVSSVFLLVYALPLAFAPMRWARFFRWRVEGDDDLTVYLGRCLGVVALALVAAGYRAALAPQRHVVVLENFAAAAFLLGFVHVWGAITRRQPWTENAEIVVYFALGAVATWLRATLPWSACSIRSTACGCGTADPPGSAWHGSAERASGMFPKLADLHER